MEFEGQEVVRYEVKLPAATVDADQPFQYGTKIRLALEVRVKGVQYKETGDGLLSRIHQFGIEDVQVVSTYHPSQELDQIEGENGPGELTGSDAEELGIEINRSARAWPAELSRSTDEDVVDAEVLEEGPVREAVTVEVDADRDLIEFLKEHSS